jgi:hypothetical protein
MYSHQIEVSSEVPDFISALQQRWLDSRCKVAI